ncbi:hypothetical protein QZH41_007956 [Actinostola sp. cb2023]|nr:hypothetical protein QZH41_007956 [Actinostola sp. cb2023]
MASIPEEVKNLLCEKFMSIRPLDPNSYSTYDLRCYDFETSFEASSIKEAATKFGYGLFHFKQLQSKTKAKPVTFECEDVFSGEKIEYQAFEILEGTAKKPLIVINKILKKSEISSSNQTDQEMSVSGEEPNLTVTDTVIPDSSSGIAIGSNLDEVLSNTLHHYFGYSEFRPLQKDIIKETLSGKNVLGVLGTGSGKSMTFMLPAVLSSHPTLVVMPTKSLIDDIFVRCQDLNIESCKFTGTIPKQSLVYDSCKCQGKNLNNPG